MAEVTVYYLRSTSPTQLKPKPAPEGVVVHECVYPQPEFNRYLYTLIGAPWEWTDKLGWTDQQWRAYVDRDELRTWVAYARGTPAGYYELERDISGTVEINYFGLAPTFIDHGIGGFLLSDALQKAWEWEASSVIVNTCSLDHPAALANYKARGMEIYDQQIR